MMRTFWIIWCLLWSVWCGCWLAYDLSINNAIGSAIQGSCLVLNLGLLWFWVAHAGD